MSHIVDQPPFSAVEPVIEVLHGVPITDPYRWLEDQNSPETRTWIEGQRSYARAYLEGIPERMQIRERVREFLDVETYDSFLKARNCYFFRKRLPGYEQPSIYFREGVSGEDQLLVDPAARGTGDYTAVKPLRVSLDGSLLLCEVKQGGERMGTFEILDVTNRKRLPDTLPHGFLRGFAFAPDAKSFYYVHEAADSQYPFHRAAYHHVLGTSFEKDRKIFFAGEDQKLRLVLIFSAWTLGFLVYRFLDRTYTDFHIWRMGDSGPAISVLRDASYNFAPHLLPGRILAAISHEAPNRRVVEVQPRKNRNPLYFDLVPERDSAIRNWFVTCNRVLVSYAHGSESQIEIFDSRGNKQGRIPSLPSETTHVIATTSEDDEIFIERQSFTRPLEIHRYSLACGTSALWWQRKLPFNPAPYTQTTVRFSSNDGTSVPMFLVARSDRPAKKGGPALMTSYGGYGQPMTPQFSVLVAIMIEYGCLFALPNIRGGSEFGITWHNAAKRRNRQVAFDDFLSAAEWLGRTERTACDKLAIFGGSNSGLLVAAAMTQRPELFRAVLCMAPLTDMLRYHLFDGAHVWKDEFGTTDDAEDFQALAAYSPYHAIRGRTTYPATMVVSGDADQNCNALHARKFIAQLQAANVPVHPVILDYDVHRGHSPVLPLTARVNGLADRISFLCDQLGIRLERVN